MAVLLGSLWALGTWGDDDDGTPPPPNEVRETEPTATPEASEDQPARDASARRSASGSSSWPPRPSTSAWSTRAGGRWSTRRRSTRTARGGRTASRSFRTNFGNNNVSMRVNGKTYRVEPSTEAIGYELRPGRRPRRLSDAQRPDCSS